MAHFGQCVGEHGAADGRGSSGRPAVQRRQAVRGAKGHCQDLREQMCVWAVFASQAELTSTVLIRNTRLDMTQDCTHFFHKPRLH